LSSIVFPDEADLLFEKGLWKSLETGAKSNLLFSGATPSAFAGVWKRRESFEEYFNSCNALGDAFRARDVAGRIALVRELISTAVDNYKKISDAGIRLQPESKGSHLATWLSVFNTYIDQVAEELEEEFE
jgi:hypothetical protein